MQFCSLNSFNILNTISCIKTSVPATVIYSKMHVAKCISMLTFLHREQFPFKAHISITTCSNVLIFAIYVENASFKCSVRFVLNIFIIVWLYLSWKNAICTKFWTGAVVRYYGYWKWCCSYIFCHKPIKFGHLVGNKLYFTIIMRFILIESKS